MQTTRALTCAFIALVAVPPLGAQVAPLAVARHSVWVGYSGDHAVSNRLGIVFDAQVRLVQNFDHERRIFVRPGVAFALTEHVKLTAGYAVSGSHIEVGDPLESRRPEHRLWASAQLSHQAGRVSLAHRYRLEHRWLSGVSVDDAGTPIGETWVTAERMRYSLRAAIPLTRSGRRHDLYAAASDEVFASFGGYAGNLAVDQNRAALVLGIRASRSTRLEMGYLLQSSADDGGRFTERNHAVQIAVVSTAALRRRSPGQSSASR